MINKKIIIYISVGVLLLIVILAVLRIGAKKQKSTPAVSPTPFYQGGFEHEPILEKPATTSLKINNVELPNFYTSETKINPRGDATIDESGNHAILYFSKEEEFLISVLSSPFDDARKMAEEEFLNKLSIDRQTACKLNVVETTPAFVNPDQAGKNYRLSFCEQDK